MPKATVTQGSNYPLEEGVYFPASLQSVDYKEIPYERDGKTKYFRKWEWEFQISSGEHQGMVVQGNTEPEINFKDMPSGSLALARPWYVALLGRELEIGEEVDTDVILGLPCNISVRQLEPRAKRDGEGYWFNVEVDDVLPGQPASMNDEPPF